VLDDVERRRLLVHPAGEDPLELSLGIADVELDEGTCQFLHFPRRGSLAGAQPNDHVAVADRLAGPQLEIAGDAVSLVEQPDHRNPLRHRRGAGRDGGYRLWDIDRLRFVGRRRSRRVALRLALLALRAAGGKRGEKGGKRAGADGSAGHA
jgi:hypothetical protein